MNKMTMVAVAALAAFGAVADEKQDATQRDLYEYFGDKLKDTRRQKGAFVFVNCQKAAPAAWLRDVTGMIDSAVNIDTKVTEGAFDVLKPAKQGEVCVFVVDDAKLPASLYSPEAGWAMMNVAPLKTEKAKFFEMRVKKSASRSFALLCGASDSQFPLSLTGNVRTVDDLDRRRDEKLPFDVLRRIVSYVKGYGIAPYVPSNYRKACQEGWAAAPTNAVQKEIWDEVHAIPDKPIKIKYDPKKTAK